MNELTSLKELYKLISPCNLCPLRCNVERLKGEIGLCNSDIFVKISSAVLYKGEEPPLSGRFGSGTIFFSNCNLKCVYCQNYNFSQLGSGKTVSVRELSNLILSLEKKGAANINFVTATHYAPQAMAALTLAREKGLKIPTVWNTIGYETVQVIKLLNNFIDIYLPDLRYVNDEDAFKYSRAPRYFEITLEAIKEMVKAKNIRFGTDGLLKEGVVVRYLVFPGKLDELRIALRLLKKEFGDSVFISVMTQYVPVYRAYEFKELARKLLKEEINEVKKIVKEEGLKNGWIQYD
ncbi:radical SAM protein [Caldisericum sp. AR60]|uniref:radical SAM protein n=1 Tax=Caldisericum sp. AR60 TaxID=3397852 RepID=UPI0039FBD9E0